MTERIGSTDIESLVITRFNWDYAAKQPRLRALYEKGKAAQWNAVTDIDWTPQLHYGAPLTDSPSTGAAQARRPDNCPVPRELWNDYRWEYHAWITSQFLHGEQGALLATARLVETAPDLDDKFYAASQVTDEARHVEAFSMYLERLGTVTRSTRHSTRCCRTSCPIVVGTSSTSVCRSLWKGWRSPSSG